MRLTKTQVGAGDSRRRRGSSRAWTTADGSDTYTSTSTATRAFSTLKDTVDIGLGFGEDTRRLRLEHGYRCSACVFCRGGQSHRTVNDTGTPQFSSAN